MAEVINRSVLEKTIKHCRERKILIPTFSQLKNPDTIPDFIKEKLKKIGLWEVHPLNLFRITWKNTPPGKDGVFGEPNFFEIPSIITGVKAKIVGMVGKYFPTGAHKVGAAFGCLVPELITGRFDPTREMAVWPSTGNFCRGGAFDCALLGCDAIAILPEGMSRERFEWLESIGTKEIIKTPGTESNVKEIYDKCWELKRERGSKIKIFNQFEEFGNSIWHYHITGSAIEEVYLKHYKNMNLAGFVSATGSAGTIAAGDYLKKKYLTKILAAEALQCPTLYLNGYGAHRIEGIGDKHVPWIHNVRNLDLVAAIDDEVVVNLLRLFNEEEGLKFLVSEGLSQENAGKLSLLGFSGICNLIASIKLAKYFELGSNDIIFTIFTDSADLYKSRLIELNEIKKYTREDAISHYTQLKSLDISWIKELNYYERKAIHNLKYFTWVEQQGKSVEELNKLWDLEFWEEKYKLVEEWDKLIMEFNRESKVIEFYKGG